MSMRDPYHPEQAHENLFIRIQDDIKGINEHMLDCARRIEVIDASTKSAHKRINDREEEIKIISSLAHSVKTIADEMKDLKADVKSHGDDIALMKRTPGDLAVKALGIFIGALITGVAGLVIGLMWKGGL